MVYRTKLLTLGAILVLFKLSCSPQTNNKDKEVVVKDTKDIGDEGGSVEIEGAAVEVAAGTLAAGSSVAIAKVDVPGEFSSNGSESASNAVSISAKDKDGKSIDSVDTPMTIAIDYGEGSSLALLGDKADLCVLLKAKAGLFVWRSGSLKIDTSKVELSTLNFGTFQAVYCGTKSLPNFKEATKAQTGEKGNDVSMVIPTGSPDFGHGKYCLATLAFIHEDDSDKSDDSDESDDKVEATVIASFEADASKGSDQTLTMEVASGDIHEHKEHLIIATYEKKGQACPLTSGDNLSKSTKFSHSAFFAFKVDNASLAAGFEGTLFESGPFETVSHKIAVGRGDDSNDMGSIHPESKVCVEIESKDTGKGSFATAIASDGIGSDNEFTFYEPIGDAKSEELRMSVKFGEDCSSPDDRPSPSAKTGLPYILNFEDEDINEGTTNYITPVNLHVLLPKGVACVRVYRDGAISSGDYGDPLGETLIELNGSSYLDYKIYLPFISGAKYDIQLTLMETGKTCEDTSSSVIPTTDIKGKGLTSDIYIPELL